MRRLRTPGTAIALPCLAFALCFLASCTKQPAAATNVQNEPEGEQLIEAMKKHPSLAPGSKLAGPPIHVDPYVHSKGMTHMGGMQASTSAAKSHSTK